LIFAPQRSEITSAHSNFWNARFVFIWPLLRTAEHILTEKSRFSFGMSESRAYFCEHDWHL